jgi:hypothetical protein
VFCIHLVLRRCYSLFASSPSCLTVKGINCAGPSNHCLWHSSSHFSSLPLYLVQPHGSAMRYLPIQLKHCLGVLKSEYQDWVKPGKNTTEKILSLCGKCLQWTCLWSMVKCNGKVVPVHAMKAYGGRRGIAPLILNLSVDGGEWLSSHLGQFTTRKELRYPLNRRLGGPWSQSGHSGA